MNQSDTLAAVRAAVRDYFEGWYDADLIRIDRALHPGLVKRSIDQVRDGTGPTTKERMLELVRLGGGTEDKTDDPIEISVLDVHHDIACAVVRSAQYREYVHLIHSPAGWQVAQAFWRLTDVDGQP